MKRILSICLALVMCLALLPADMRTASADTVSGWCGENVQWSYNMDTGKLSITGSGEMDTNFNDQPWYDHRPTIKTVTIGSGVTSIGDYAFCGCTKLTSVTIPSSVKTIGYAAFYECKSLPSVTIGSGVESIRSSAFGGCTGLSSISFPNSVKTVETFAFENCTGLQTVTFGSGVSDVYSNVFYGCTGITKYAVSSASTHLCAVNDTLFSHDKTELIAFPAAKSATSYTIPNTVETVGAFAFAGCRKLTSITIGKNVENIDYNAFEGCSGITKFSIASGNACFCVVGDVLFSADKTLLVAYPAGKSATSYTIPNSVKTVGESAFISCKKLTSVSFGSSVTLIDDVAFSGCTGLSSISFPSSLKTIGNYAFSGCAGLKTLTVPNSVTSMGWDAFEDCTSLSSVKIGTGLRKIPEWSFWGCEKLTTITIPESVTAIEMYAFAECDSLTDVRYDGLKAKADNISIGEGNDVLTNAVWHYALAVVTQPESLTAAVGKNATFKITAEGSGVTYQWQFSKNNGASWTNWSGKTSASATVKASETNNGCLYRCIVKNSKGSITSNSARLTVSGIKPNIVEQPKSKTVAVGKNATFRVISGGVGKTYQWQYSKNNGASWTNWSGKTSYSVTVKASATNNGCLYRCVIKNDKGSVWSKPAQLTVSGVKPNILRQPLDETTYNGLTALFTVEAAGVGNTYRWQYSTDGGKTWKNCSSTGADTAVFSFTAKTSYSGRRYRCVIKNSVGSVTTRQALLKVN